MMSSDKIEHTEEEMKQTIKELKMPIDKTDRTNEEIEWAASELATAFAVILPLLLSRSVLRLDSHIEGVGSITAYWVNDILRIDIKLAQE